MTYDRPDDRDPARASASVTRTDLPQQTEFRLVASPPGTPAGGTPDGAAPDGQRAPTQPVPVVPAPAPARPAPAGPGQPAPGRSARASADSDEDPIPSGMEELQAGWQRVKAAFVDNPRGAVAEAAVLADEAAEALAAALRERRQQIRDTWDGDGPSRDTEALRRALLRYQALFKSITRDTRD